MTMALRHGCLLGAFLLLCAAQLSSACSSCGTCPTGGGGGTGGTATCAKGNPLAGAMCGKMCPSNFDCSVNSNGKGVCCPHGYLGYPPPYTTVGVGYQEALHNLLIPKDKMLDHVISLRFQAPAVTVTDVCGKSIPFPAVNTEVTGIPQMIAEPALAIGCGGVERNLGTTVYQLKPAASFNIRAQSGQSFDVNPNDRFCLFMFDAGTDPTPGSDTDMNIEEATPFYLRLKPFIQWSVCNIPGNNIMSGTVINDYLPMPANGPTTRRATYVLFRQQRFEANMDVSQYLAYPTDPVCNRCRFDIKSFISTYQLETKAVLTVRAASDAVGMDMDRKLQWLTTGQMCGLYNQVISENAATDNGSR